MSLETVTCSEVPIVIKNCLNWDILKWSPENWCDFLTNPTKKYPFRVGKMACSKDPQWERNCIITDMTFSDFIEKFKDDKEPLNWWYFDYKHIEEWFFSKAETMGIDWKNFGFPDKTAKDSTLWMGTKGAHTSCHIDTYGSNLVAQVYGRKRWYLFPPSETDNLQPTRVPYEESSIYSSLNFFCGCSDISAIKEVYSVDLEPGDVLFVPFHWWHYVENISSAISVNMWIPSEHDDICRVEESLVKYFMSSVCKNLDTEEIKHILNPNEDDLPILEERGNLEELLWCLEKSKETKREIIKQTTDHKHKVCKISPETLIDSLKRKCKGNKDDEKSKEVYINRKNMINSFCHPEVISLIRTKLQNNYFSHLS